MRLIKFTSRTFVQLRRDNAGFAISAELVLIATIAVVGLIVSSSALRDSVVSELSDIGGAVQDLQASYEVNGIAGHSSTVAGMSFNDGIDFCDSPDDQPGVADNCITFTEPPSNETGAEAQFIGGFESGFSGFDTIGNASIQGDAFGPTEGSSLAVLTTGDSLGGGAPFALLDLETFLGGAELGLSSTGVNSTSGSALSFDVEGAVGSSLTFDFNFFTNESSSDFNDSAFLTIDGEVVSTLADVFSPNVPSANTGFFSETGFSNFEFAFENDGPVNIGIAVVDVGDSIVDSGIAVDNIAIVPTTP